MNPTRMLDYHHWANRRLMVAIEKLTPEQFTREVGGSFPSIRATVAHLIDVDETWLARFLGQPVPAVLNPEDTPDSASARARWEAIAGRLRAWSAEADMTATFTMRNSKGQEFTHTYGEALLHVVNHGTYHRGQLTAQLRQVGAESSATDLILYLRG